MAKNNCVSYNVCNTGIINILIASCKCQLYTVSQLWIHKKLSTRILNLRTRTSYSLKLRFVQRP